MSSHNSIGYNIILSKDALLEIIFTKLLIAEFPITETFVD